jgi:hypothetical protein
MEGEQVTPRVGAGSGERHRSSAPSQGAVQPLFPQLRPGPSKAPAAAAAHQRARLHAAMIEACARHGYAETKVREVAGLAGVSTKTLYKHFEFLEQNHIKTVCTRVQFAAGDGNGSACPKGSIYGRAKAWTPLLDRPLEGYVYLRSNGGERKLPDLVAALDGQIDIALWGKVDSGPNHGIRNTFEVVPDAPVSRFMLEMRGGKKGLLVNSENLCSKQAKRRAIVRLVGQNGKVQAFKPLVGRRCKRAAKGR